MPDTNAILDKVLRGVIWLLPGLLILLGIILVVSYVDRWPKRNQRSHDDKHPGKP